MDLIKFYFVANSERIRKSPQARNLLQIMTSLSRYAIEINNFFYKIRNSWPSRRGDGLPILGSDFFALDTSELSFNHLY